MTRTRLLLAPVLAAVLASPAAAAEVEVKTVEPVDEPPVWDRQTVAVEIGDTVRWTFEGTAQAHNVRSDDINDDWPEPFQSAVAAPAQATTSEPFTAVGRYRFLCSVHPDSMWGDVLVGEPPPPPPPPLGEQPFANDSGEPAVFETGAFDDTAPVLSVAVQRAGRGARIWFSVSERSRVVARFVRGGRTRKRARVTTDGRGAITVRNGLEPGRYRVDVRAEDLAGNVSARRVRHLAVG